MNDIQNKIQAILFWKNEPLKVEDLAKILKIDNKLLKSNGRILEINQRINNLGDKSEQTFIELNNLLLANS